jgi:hypothetical protein
MQLRETKKHLHRDGTPRKLFGCPNWPQCDGTHGAHPDGRPLGTPGDSATKAARHRAHEAFDALREKRGWVGGSKQTNGAYVWLGRKLGIAEERIKEDCHIAMFDVATCERVVVICTEAMGRSKQNIPLKGANIA